MIQAFPHQPAIANTLARGEGIDSVTWKELVRNGRPSITTHRIADHHDVFHVFTTRFLRNADCHDGPAPGVLRGNRAETLELTSPGGTVRAKIWCAPDGRLSWSLERAGVSVLGASPLGISVDDVDLGLGVSLGQAKSTEINETFIRRGVKPAGTDHCRLYEIPVRHLDSRVEWTLQVRLFEDGLAWRYRVPGTGTRRAYR